MSRVEVMVDPPEALLDEAVCIQVTGLEPHDRVRVTARTEAFRAQSWGDFIADASGVVDVARSAPVAGTYSGCDPLGLFWSAELDAGADLIDVFMALANLAPLDCVITVDVDGSEVARANVARRTLGAGVTRDE